MPWLHWREWEANLSCKILGAEPYVLHPLPSSHVVWCSSIFYDYNYRYFVLLLAIHPLSFCLIYPSTHHPHQSFRLCITYIIYLRISMICHMFPPIHEPIHVLFAFSDLLSPVKCSIHALRQAPSFWRPFALIGKSQNGLTRIHKRCQIDCLVKLTGMPDASWLCCRNDTGTRSLWPRTHQCDAGTGCHPSPQPDGNHRSQSNPFTTWAFWFLESGTCWLEDLTKTGVALYLSLGHQTEQQTNLGSVVGCGWSPGSFFVGETAQWSHALIFKPPANHWFFCTCCLHQQFSRHVVCICSSNVH